MRIAKRVALPISRQLLDRCMDELTLRSFGEVDDPAELDLHIDDNPMTSWVRDKSPIRKGRPQQGTNLEEGDLMVLGEVEDLEAGSPRIARAESPGC